MKTAIDRFDIEKIASLYDVQNYKQCNELAKKVSEIYGHSTPWINWIRGVCEDMLGNPFEGLKLFKMALEGDPFNYNYMLALNANLNIFRNGLLNALETEDSLFYVEAVHKCLLKEGEFSSSLQYLVIKNYIRHNKFTEAYNLLQGYLMNSPNDHEALALEKMIDNANMKLMVC
jgi:hypothetical protein